VNRLKVRSCLIDSEAVACDENGLAVFEQLRYRRQDARVFLYAFDLLDLRREPLETRRRRWPACYAAAEQGFG
jgi:ATP-dependent DNA ligase